MELSLRLDGIPIGPTWQGEFFLGADTNGRVKATQDLADGKADAVPVLTVVLRTAAEPEARWRAADALGRVGADARSAGGDPAARGDRGG